MRALLTLLIALACIAPSWGALSARAQPSEPTPEAFRADALSIEALINSQYAYLDRLPDGAAPMSQTLRAEADAVGDRQALLRYAERAVSALADHHAITGGSFHDSWALAPSFADLWIEPEGDLWRITAVRNGSPAAEAGVRPGDSLTAIGDRPTGQAVAAYWADLGLGLTDDRAGYAVRVLAAGRRDRARDLTIRDAAGRQRRLSLPGLYHVRTGDRPPVSVHRSDDELIIRFHDSLGDPATISAFDAAMATALPDQTIVLDLTDTASGGNTVVARGVMGWFVDAPTAYQIHSLPAEERRTGVPRQWIEQVLPRSGKRHRGPVRVRVGRWTGSMGEGLAVGMDALGAEVTGEPMAGLLGAVYDHRLANSGLVIKLPTERLYAVDGTPREAFRPRSD